ncbi:hypothetical protein FOZ61_000144 [Perkinsus olseni]|uniref:Uncharacterized protein n=1 Tax=Perkinsus olseni TaxID=32597 RepID=A0A7J6L6V9_PEROL|nr:hypothetical protein FOZ61_000144 [Perkinsus olseni]KAF4654903.1 hypothetical protein FOL46_008477 [Perkinsus olseni]
MNCQVRKLEPAALERRRTAARIVTTEESKTPANASKLSRMSMRLMRGTEDLIGSKSKEYDRLPVHGYMRHCTPDMIIVTGRKGLNQRINGGAADPCEPDFFVSQEYMDDLT